MSEPGSSMRDLPSALGDGEALNERLAGRHPGVFLDYDGTLTPIVDRPEDAVISESMREAVRALARRCTACVDEPLVDRLLAEHPDELKLTPGKMVYEIQPTLEWDKGKAGLHLLYVLDLDREDIVAV